jgi:hypothetical protein
MNVAGEFAIRVPRLRSLKIIPIHCCYKHGAPDGAFLPGLQKS